MNSIVRVFVSLFVVANVVLSVAIVQAEDLNQNRPNVVVFLSDDQGYGDFSYTGNKDLSTPNIDSLARDGAFVENFYVCPVCSPTRAEFLTGRYAARCGVYSTSAGGERIDLDESTIAEAFKSAGYATAAFGKWHNGMQAPFHPNSRGFDEYYGFCSGHWGHYFDPVLERNGKLVRGDGFCVDDFTNHAIQFIENNQDKPFFVYLPYNTPHSPMQVPDKQWDKFRDKELTQLPPEFKKASKQKGKGIKHARAALAMCENIDNNVGRVLAKLDQLKLADNTIVIYFCDNGPNGARYNAGLKGRKGSTDEGGVHSPLFVRWPAKIKPGGKVNLVAGAIDLYPTLADLCGFEAKPNKPLDGISFAPELKGMAVRRPERYLFSYWNQKLSVRSAQYRLDNKGVLFDIVNDVRQRTPITDQPDVKKALAEAVVDFKKTVAAELDRETTRAFPIGHASMKNTQMPARDAVVTGKLKRSNRYPNCSYFLNWIDENDTITWPVDVQKTGSYKVDLHYCCAEKDLGTVVELSLGDSKLTKKISVANVSKIIGADEDRSVRGESYVKNFLPVEMGVIRLEKGRGNLVLKAIEIPGDESIEFRLLMFTKVD
ncbi:MAG: sulfatase-like hydrolase/transferase [Mariniblastus sp.]